MASHWYVLHVDSGFEQEVADAIRERATGAGLSGRLGDVVVPQEETAGIERASGERLERRFFPGYLLIEMEPEDDIWRLIRNIDHLRGRKRPAPITASAAERLRASGR